MTDFLDTNVLVYAFDDRDSDKQDRALALLAGGGFVLSTQVLGEFFVTVTKKLPKPLPAREAADTVDDLALQRVISVDAAMTRAATRTSETDQLSYWDALIIEAAAVAGCPRVLSEDLNDGQVIRGVQIVNPFTEPR